MEYALIAVVIVIVIAVVLFSRSGPKEVEGGEKIEQLPSGEKPKNKLSEKLEERQAQMSGEKKPDSEKADEKASAKGEDKAGKEKKGDDKAAGAEKKPEKKAEEKPAEKPSEKAEKPAEAVVEKAAEKKAEEPVAAEVKAEVKAGESKAAEAPKAAEAAPVSIAAPAPKAVPKTPKTVKKPIDVEAVRRGLVTSRSEGGFFQRLSSLVRGKREIDPSIVAELEEVLLTSDVGVKTTEKLVERVRSGIEKHELSDATKVWEALRSEAKKILSIGGGGLVVSQAPTVVMMVGVNGAGKTTTIGKIATKLSNEKQQVVLAAGDTFRAAAVQQLEVWGKRVGCEVVKGKDGADPAGVAFEAVTQARTSGADVVLIDTAGRLQTKTPLMDELKKIGKSVGKAVEGAPNETLLVVDATTGQNALNQAKVFGEALKLTGIVLTKLDGTAKGGVILSICDELGVPVRYIGLGERSDDLHEFDADEYVEAMFGEFGKETSV